MRAVGGEFDLIYRTIAPHAGYRSDVVLGIGDDAALLQPMRNQHLVVAQDTMVAGRHFFPDQDPADVAWKALAVNLSDLAAMGATPHWALLSLTLPRNAAHPEWMSAFMQGWQALATQHQVALIGGDTTSGEQLTISVTVIGQRHQDSVAMLRSGAKAGDDLWVSGQIGSAGLALAQRIAHQALDVDIAHRLHRPEPRVALGQALLPFIHACIDVSDGLLADRQHLLTASGGLGVRIESESVPMYTAVKAWAEQTDWYRPLIAGDDYELLFTADPLERAQIEQQAETVGVCVTRIGHITSDVDGIEVYRAGQKLSLPRARGFDHFVPSDTMAQS